MSEHERFYRELACAQHDKGGRLSRAELFEVLLHHVAHSSHRMALPADWTTEEVTWKLRVVFTDNPLIEAMLDDFEGLPNGHELSA